jgi:hypothetical protein
MKFFLVLHLMNAIIVCSVLQVQAQATDEYKPIERLLHPPPVPDFYISGLCYGDTTYFTNKTDIGITSWVITNDKGDTLYTTAATNMTYFFKKKGVYNICLQADNGHLATKVQTVLVDTITHADFIYRRCINEFNNQSTCADQFVWIFPDSSTTTNAFASYQFASGGTFPVKLIAKKGSKLTAVTKMVSIPADSIGIPTATFTWKRHGTANTFDLIADDSVATNYSWTFGDRQFDDTSGYKTTHTFDMDKYDGMVGLRVSTSCGFSLFESDPFSTTGIDEDYFFKRNVMIYPNPATDELNIVVNNKMYLKEVVVKLIDANGAVLQENKLTATPASSHLKINISSIAKGIYVVQIWMGDQLLNKKIVIQ